MVFAVIATVAFGWFEWPNNKLVDRASIATSNPVPAPAPNLPAPVGGGIPEKSVTNPSTTTPAARPTHAHRSTPKLSPKVTTKAQSPSSSLQTLCVVRGMFNQAIESGLLDLNPAARLGPFTRSARTTETKGIALTGAEVQQLAAALEICPEYHPLFLTAVRTGMRRGELVALQWGDIQFGRDDEDQNRFIIVRHNYVRREHTTTKSKRTRRVDLSRELRKTLLVLRDKRLLEAFLEGKNDISGERVFPSPDGSILDPDNLYHRYFLPVLAKAGIRKIRLHDLRTLSVVC